MAGTHARRGRGGPVRPFRDGVALARIERDVIAAVFRGGVIPTGDAILIDDVLDGGAEPCMADDCDAIAEAMVELHYGTPHLRRSVQIVLCGRDYAAWCADWPTE